MSKDALKCLLQNRYSSYILRIWKKSPDFIWRYLKSVNPTYDFPTPFHNSYCGRFYQIIVVFSEYMNFTYLSSLHIFQARLKV